MMSRSHSPLFLGLALLLAGAAAAQTLHWPRLGRPAITAPGGVLEVSASAEGAISLERAGQATPLEVQWTRTGGQNLRGRAILPTSLQAGAYALQLQAGSTSVTSPSAVYLRTDIPDDYALAIFRGAPSASGPALPADLATQLKAAAVQLAILLGPLTRGGEDDLHTLEALLRDSDIPLYVCPDRADLRLSPDATVFTDSISCVTFGRDGYLFLGTGLYADNTRTTEQMGDVYRARRALRASRWSVGVAGEYGLDWELRAQEALFMDDPLNLLIANFSSPPLPEVGAVIPWGKTALLPAADTPGGSLAVFDVTSAGIKPRTSPPSVAPLPQDGAAGK